MNPDVARRIEWPMIITGSVTSILAGLSLSDWGVIIGILIGLAGLVMKLREHKLTIRKTNAEINEINKRVVFMDRAGLNPVNYYTPPPELEALKDPKDEQPA